MSIFRRVGLCNGPALSQTTATGQYAGIRQRLIGGRAHNSHVTCDLLGTGHTHPMAIDPDIEEAHRHALDLYALALKLVGFEDPPKIFDGHEALETLANARWLDKVLRGETMVPHIGELARHGLLTNLAVTIQEAIKLCERSRRCLEVLYPCMRRMDQVLRLFAPGVLLPLDRMIEVTARMVVRYGGRLEPLMPDIRRHFKFREMDINGMKAKIGIGRLGIPGKVLPDGQLSTPRSASVSTGKTVGHMFGARFGTPRAVNPLPEQSWRGPNFTDYQALEQMWDELLQTGYGIEAKITDLTRKNQDRPFERQVEWTEINPNGSRIVRREIFTNANAPQANATEGGTDEQGRPTGAKPKAAGEASRDLQEENPHVNRPRPGQQASTNGTGQ